MGTNIMEEYDDSEFQEAILNIEENIKISSQDINISDNRILQNYDNKDIFETDIFNTIKISEDLHATISDVIKYGGMGSNSIKKLNDMIVCFNSEYKEIINETLSKIKVDNKI